MRIGILGGSFDPVHCGHLALAGAALKELSLDRIYFVPAKKSPFKSHPPLASEQERLALLRNAIREIPPAKISLVELNCSVPSYTIDTVRYFSKKFVGDQLFLVMGSDTLANFHRWKKWREIFNFCKLSVAQREGTRINKTVAWKNVREKIICLKSKMPDISSTQLRIEQQEAKHSRALVKILAHLKNTMPSKRFNHILSVMRLAEQLAQKHRAPGKKAKLAAALHDLARCWSAKKLIQYVQTHHLKIPAKEWCIQNQPVLLHSYVSADLAKREFSIRDAEVLSAIKKHTLADFTMTLLDKILFLADLTAEDRNFSGVQKLRNLSFVSLDQAFLEGLAAKMEYLLKSRSLIHPQAAQIWNRFVQERR